MEGYESVFSMTLLAILFGGTLIIGALFLVYARRISLDQVAKNPSLETQEMKIEILNLIKVSSNVPALSFFIVGLVLVVSGLYYANEEGKRKADDAVGRLTVMQKTLDATRGKLELLRKPVRVSGMISKSDHSAPTDIDVQIRWPPFHPDDNGKLSGLLVQRDVDGRLPTLSFSHPNYGAVSVDLDSDAKPQGSDLVILDGEVILRRLPGKGGTP